MDIKMKEKNVWDKHDLHRGRAKALKAGGCKLITLLLKAKLFLMAIRGTSMIACALTEALIF